MNLVSKKKNIESIIKYLKTRNIFQVIICPGSRNLPFIQIFSNDIFFKCISIIDERVAGYIALGICKASKSPCIVLTTSGSAIVNLSSALLEAYYQNIPLIALTADRPLRNIDIGENQTFFQHEVYKNFIKKSISLHQDVSIDFKDVDEYLFTKSSLGPIHINCHIEEPLLDQYVEIEYPILEKFEYVDNEIKNPNEFFFNNSKNIIIYVSNDEYSSNEIAFLEKLSSRQNIVVVSELNNFTHSFNTVTNIDKLLKSSSPMPDILITIGQRMINNKCREIFKNIEYLKHIDINRQHRNWPLSKDFIFLKGSICDIEKSFSVEKKINSQFGDSWIVKEKKYRTILQKLTENNPKSELTFIYNFISNNNIKNVFWGNSSIVRIANVCHFLQQDGVKNHINRGISGIDGVLATAIGYNIFKKEPTVCIIGDVSMIYEIGALVYLKECENFTLIILNNNGGRIFDIIHPHLDNKSQNFLRTEVDPQWFEIIKNIKVNKTVNISVINFDDESLAPWKEFSYCS